MPDGSVTAEQKGRWRERRSPGLPLSPARRVASGGIRAEPFSDFSGPRIKHAAPVLLVACHISGCEKHYIWSLSRVQAQLLNPEEIPEWQE